MKSTLTIIIVIISLLSCNACSCKSAGVSYYAGEKRCDTIRNSTLTHGDVPMHTVSSHSNGPITTTGTLSIAFKYDTLRVIMLVCDTSDPKGQFFIDYKSTWWQYGYEIRKTNPQYHTFEGAEYLDENKQPIKPSIVVWRTITVK